MSFLVSGVGCFFRPKFIFSTKGDSPDSYTWKVEVCMGQSNGLTKGLVVGFLAGGAIGAILALLYAPKSGKELRADMKEKAGDILEDAEGYVRAARTKAGDIMSDAKKRSDQLISDAKKKAGTLLEDADKILADARQKTATILEEGTRVKDAVKAGVSAFKEERNRS
jgi:gas vesicle protein